MRLVLASASPRRRALLEEAGIPFTAVEVAVEEVLPEFGEPHAVAVENAVRKARAAKGDVVAAADTVVALGNRLLGKPPDEDGARAMLALLSGTTHRVVTGVAVLVAGRLGTDSVESRVTMRDLDPAEIEAYVASGEAMGKAGAYAIQETGDRFVTVVDGPLDNVVGLPVDALRDLLRRAGVRML